MTVIDLNRDRRHKRSTQAHTAIRYQLEHVFHHQQLHQLVLGDSSGLVLAGAGDADDAEVLAAYAPVLETYRGKSRGKLYERLAGRMSHFNPAALSLRSFQVDGERLFLCSMGRESAVRQASLYRAITGVRRILAQTATAA